MAATSVAGICPATSIEYTWLGPAQPVCLPCGHTISSQGAVQLLDEHGERRRCPVCKTIILESVTVHDLLLSTREFENIFNLNNPNVSFRRVFKDVSELPLHAEATGQDLLRAYDLDGRMTGPLQGGAEFLGIVDSSQTCANRDYVPHGHSTSRYTEDQLESLHVLARQDPEAPEVQEAVQQVMLGDVVAARTESALTKSVANGFKSHNMKVLCSVLLWPLELRSLFSHCPPAAPRLEVHATLQTLKAALAAHCCPTVSGLQELHSSNHPAFQKLLKATRQSASAIFAAATNAALIKGIRERPDLVDALNILRADCSKAKIWLVTGNGGCSASSRKVVVQKIRLGRIPEMARIAKARRRRDKGPQLAPDTSSGDSDSGIQDIGTELKNLQNESMSLARLAHLLYGYDSADGNAAWDRHLLEDSGEACSDVEEEGASDGEGSDSDVPGWELVPEPEF